MGSNLKHNVKNYIKFEFVIEVASLLLLHVLSACNYSIS